MRESIFISKVLEQLRNSLPVVFPPRTLARTPIGKVTAGCRAIAIVIESVGVDSLSIPKMKSVEIYRLTGAMIQIKYTTKPSFQMIHQKTPLIDFSSSGVFIGQRCICL